MKTQYVDQFKKYLQLAAMSPRTVAVYCKILEDFLNFVPDAHFATTQDLINFALTKKSNSYRKQCQGVFKHFYTSVIHKPSILKRLPRIKKAKPIPEILSEVEINQVLFGIDNLKHKAIITLLYFAGMRISEIINLKIADINGTNATVHIKKSKGAKDRVVPINETVMQLLRDYFKAYKPAVFLFNSYKKGTKYSAKSIQKVLTRAVARQEIKKNITPHSLRHSRATHLLRNGVDIKLVKDFLGHAHIKTTEMYLHLTLKTMQQSIARADQKINLMKVA